MGQYHHVTRVNASEFLFIAGMACFSSLVPLTSFVAGRAGARPDHPILADLGHSLGFFCLVGRESYRELRLELLSCPHRVNRGTAPHEREYPRRKDRF